MPHVPPPNTTIKEKKIISPSQTWDSFFANIHPVASAVFFFPFNDISTLVKNQLVTRCGGEYL
jgi:hypothetical protein